MTHLLHRLHLLLIGTLLLAVGMTGCYDRASEPSTEPATPPPATTTIGELRRLFAGETFVVESDVVVCGRVTTSDQAGNFYRTLVLEADGAAVEVMAGIDGLHNIYPAGCDVTLRLQGLALGQSYGVLQVGRAPAPGSGYATDYIGSRAALDRHLVRGTCKTPLAPTLRTIDELTPDMAGCLIRVDGLRFMPKNPEETTWSGYKRFTDDEGHEIETYTRLYADFADDAIPTGEVLLVGILQCSTRADGSTRYMLKMRDESDCWY